MGLDDTIYNLACGVPRHRKKFLFALLSALVAAYYYNRKCLKLKRECPEVRVSEGRGRRDRHHAKVGVNMAFIQQLRKLVPICIPGIASKEFALLAGLALVLIVRTGLDIWFSAFNGIVVRAIVTRDWRLFSKNAIFLFAFMMWPMSMVNNSIKLIINNLSLAFRTRLTHHAHNQYLNRIVFYKVSNLDNRIQNVDQLLTQDIVKFSESLSHLYSDIAKPLVDIGLFALKLGQSIGLEAPLLMLSYFATSGWILRAISPPFGRFTAKEQSLEGEFRYAHSRIIAHAEEVAFYNGARKEKTVANAVFGRILAHANRVFVLRFGNGIIDSVLVKYCATQLAYFILSRHIFSAETDRVSGASGASVLAAAKSPAQLFDSTKIMEDYSRNSGYLINLSQAVGRLVLAGRDLTRFAGYTWRVAELFDVLDDLNRGRYQRTMIAAGGAVGVSETRTVNEHELAGQVIEADGIIEFDRVPIATPNGDMLVPEMSFRIEAGMNCLVTGPNGCGKSSLFRILGQLWPLFGGRLTKPPPADMFYVPQRPYLPLGTLRDQVIYPHTAEDFFRDGGTDAELLRLLQVVQLDYLVEREEGGWDAVRDWTDVLSGGEKQRIAMARLFHHRPRFAILDECTSAVSIDVEGVMYRHAQQQLDITLFTISHRPSLFSYHEFLLRLDGDGGYELLRLVHGEENGVSVVGDGHEDEGHENEHGHERQHGYRSMVVSARGAPTTSTTPTTSIAADACGNESHPFAFRTKAKAAVRHVSIDTNSHRDGPRCVAPMDQDDSSPDTSPPSTHQLLYSYPRSPRPSDSRPVVDDDLETESSIP